MNSDNSKSSKLHILTLRLGEKILALWKVSIYYIWENIKGLYNNNKF